MRFRFCGDLDCPDWVLAEINTLAKLSSVKMKSLCQLVAKSLIGEDMDYEKVKKLTSDAKFDTGDMKAVVAAVAFVLSSSARHGVDGDELGSELQQLGLPREHATGAVRVHGDHVGRITERLRAGSLRLSRLQDVRWRVDYVSQSSFQVGSIDEMQPEVTVALTVWDALSGKRTTRNFITTPVKLSILVEELKIAAARMDSLL
ncbi:COMM domain-containing protein 4 [Bacillus rossius redtenbacheri]|uniref:COMM domain-containing protein 4 n=1 Tax=Bacillus rossius redtenbacheri TaxID=93214 RepID=UPI002FDE43D0